MRTVDRNIFMKELVTPKQVARAIQVSESSVKRWCDKGTIPTQYTAGGHRRIPIGGLLKFLRASHRGLVRPEVVGLPATTGQTHRVIDRAVDQLTHALERGDGELSRQIIFDLYLAEHSLSVIFDEVIAKSFEAIGERWACGTMEVYQERRACEVASRLLRELRAFTPASAEDAPRAIGGTPEGDQYYLATTMIELVLCGAGWNAASLGVHLPLATLGAAIEHHQPRLFWLSVSQLNNEADFIRDYNELYDRLGSRVAFVVGGRALTDDVRHRMRYAAFCDNLQHLESFGQTLLSVQQPTVPA